MNLNLRTGLIAATLASVLLLPACTSQNQQQQMLNGQQAFQQQNYTQAFKTLKPLADKGNADAQYAVGYMYYYGKGVPKDVAQAMSWMSKAAQQGQPLAKQALAAIQQQSGMRAKFNTAQPITSSVGNTNPAANAAKNTKMPNYPAN